MYVDLINRIRNAQMAGKRVVKAPYNKMDMSVAVVLMKRGFVSKMSVIGRGVKKVLKLTLPAHQAVSGFTAISKPSVARYAGARDIKPVKSGYGLLVISTPKGVLSGEEAKRAGVGGKLLFKVW